MKTIRLLATAAALTVATALQAAPSGKTEVTFDHPENFTDVKDGFTPTDKGRDYILSNIRSFLVSRTEERLPEGYTLRIRFTDIDLAGDYEPQRGSRWDDVRIVKDIYPPAFKFTYSVSDAAGKVVREGTEDIRDLNFQSRVVLDDQDPLRYEKAVLGDWARSKLAGLKRQ
ncbi:MAG TPA: DUF3016 domain-containing protein [Opitutaceae bacterium]|jgi:hypothetical protein